MDGFTPQSHYPWIKAPGTHWVGDCVGSRTGLDAVLKRKISDSMGNQNPLAKCLIYNSILPEVLSILIFLNSFVLKSKHQFKRITKW
jgi:hypothetical protein